MLIIYNQKLAGFLMLKGFKLVGTEPNKDFKNMNVYKFNNTPKLRQAIDEFQRLKIRKAN